MCVCVCVGGGGQPRAGDVDGDATIADARPPRGRACEVHGWHRLCVRAVCARRLCSHASGTCAHVAAALLLSFVITESLRWLADHVMDTITGVYPQARARAAASARAASLNGVAARPLWSGRVQVARALVRWVVSLPSAWAADLGIHAFLRSCALNARLVDTVESHRCGAACRVRVRGVRVGVTGAGRGRQDAHLCV